MEKTPLVFTYYIAAPIEKVWEGFVSKEANRTIFMGADFEVELTPGGSMTWSGPGKDGNPVRLLDASSQWMPRVFSNTNSVRAWAS